MKRAWIIAAIVVVVLLVTLPWTIPRVRTWGYSGPTLDSVHDEMTAQLSPGDSDEQVQAVLARLLFQFRFDESEKRYDGIVRNSKRFVPAPACLPGSVKSHLLVNVYLDDHKRYASSEVIEIVDLW